jgi:hypothetical protein
MIHLTRGRNTKPTVALAEAIWSLIGQRMRPSMKRTTTLFFLLVVASFVLSACTMAHVTGHSAVGIKRRARPETCQLAVVRETEVAMHFPKHELIGVIAVEGAVGIEASHPDVKELVRPRACQIGGEVLSVRAFVQDGHPSQFQFMVYAQRLDPAQPQAF